MPIFKTVSAPPLRKPHPSNALYHTEKMRMFPLPVCKGPGKCSLVGEYILQTRWRVCWLKNKQVVFWACASAGVGQFYRGCREKTHVTMWPCLTSARMRASGNMNPEMVRRDKWNSCSSKFGTWEVLVPWYPLLKGSLWVVQWVC